MRDFNYPVDLIEQEEGGYLVQFIDLPEAITQGETVEDALNEASDCLEEAIANRMIKKLDIPEPRHLKTKKIVPLSSTLAIKTALYMTMREKNISNIALAKKLNCNEKEVRRLIDPHFKSKFPRIEEALHVLGKGVEIIIVSSSEINPLRNTFTAKKHW
jgi:antitoxin HicB